jgi:hypothetical protein
LHKLPNKEGGVVDPQDTTITLKHKVKQTIKYSELFEAARLAQEAGYRVLLTPPHHSDLQPIKLLWALVKGNVGRLYHSKTSLEQVHARLIHEFEQVGTSGHNMVAGTTQKTTSLAKKPFEDAHADDGDAASASEDPEDSDSPSETDDECI